MAKATLGYQHVARENAVEDATHAAERTLKRHFGGDYPQALRDARGAAEEYGSASFISWLETPVPGRQGLQFGSVPQLVDMLARVGKAMRGGSNVFKNPGRNVEGYGMTDRNAALAEIRRLEAERAKYQLGSTQHRALTKQKGAPLCDRTSR